MPWMPAVPSDPGPTFGPLVPIAVVLHRTYGQWPGDYQVGKTEGLFQFLIGPDDGQWVEFAPTDAVCYHCNGANFKAFGVELTGTNADPLTDWQAARLGDVLRWANATHGIPLAYTDPVATPPASIHANGGGFSGIISHVSVQTDDGSTQHTDLVTVSDFQRALASPPPPVPMETDSMFKFTVDAPGTPEFPSGVTYRCEPAWGLLDRLPAGVDYGGMPTYALTPTAVQDLFQLCEAHKQTLSGTGATKVTSTVTSVLS